MITSASRFAFCRPITIKDGAWVAARAVVCPGNVLGRMSVVEAGVVWNGVAEPHAVYSNTARPESPVRLSA